MKAAYAKAGVKVAAGYTGWANFATGPYQSATHGSRYVNNYASKEGAFRYGKYEDVGWMPRGSVLAKDSFVVNANGTLAVGPLFLMEKMERGFHAASYDWRYTMIMPDGSVFGTTKGKNSARVQFCIDCHEAVAEDQDSLFFLPDEFRVQN